MKIAMLCAETAPDFLSSPGYAGGNHLELIAEAAWHEPDILLAPEYFLYRPDTAPCTRDEKEELLKQIAGIAGREDNLIAPGTIVWQDDGFIYNTAPVFIGRKKVKEHHKSMDKDMLKIAEGRGLIVRLGAEPGTVIDWRGRKIGFEICVEHKQGLLSHSGERTDLHIVLGCNGELKDEFNTARRRLFRKGYILLCDGFRECRANPGSGEFADDIEPEKQGNVLLYDIHI